MAASQGLIWIIFITSSLQLIDISQATKKAVMCYDCTSWNPYCANSVEIPFPEAVAIVECNITKTCFIRKEADGMISRGCADWWMFSSVSSDYLGCQKQDPLWMKPQEWCFCNTDYCNGNSMDDIKQLNGQKPDLHLQDTQSQDETSDEDDSSDEDENQMMEQVVHPPSEETTILPWWWWYVHWSTEKPYWLEEIDNHEDTNDEQMISSEEELKPKETTQKWWKSGKVTTFSDWWDVPAVPTGPVGVHKDRQDDAEHVHAKQKQNDVEDNKNDDIEKKFFCWDCSSKHPLCGETVNTPVSYYVGRVACPMTQKCFIRKDKGVIYRGCADGWIDSSIDYYYVGCKNQTIWDREVEWCFCSSPYCNNQSIDSLTNNHPIIIYNEKAQNMEDK